MKMIQPQSDQDFSFREAATAYHGAAVVGMLGPTYAVAETDLPAVYGLVPAYPNLAHPTALSLTMFFLSTVLTLFALLKRGARRSLRTDRVAARSASRDRLPTEDRV